MNQVVKSCKNCTIDEVWVQIIGMPSEIKNDPENPYPLFQNLKTFLKEKYQLKGKVLPKGDPILFNMQTGPHKTSISPPFWNGEIRWKEDDYIKVLRVGHQFFALHSLFNEKPYDNYQDSFEVTLKKVIDSIEEINVFEAIQIVLRYVNKIEINTDNNKEFSMAKYFNTNFSYGLKQPLLNTNLGVEFVSENNKNRIIGFSAHTSGQLSNQSVVNIVQTTGVEHLNNKIKLNHKGIFDAIKSIKEDLKEVFFDTMTQETKDNIMGVEYV